MKRIRLRASVLLAAIATAWIGTSHASLVARGLNGNPLPYGDANAVFYYDTALDITWLRDWNAGAGSSFDLADPYTNGYMTWGNAAAWAGSLTYFGGGWRLPKIAPVNGVSYQYSHSNNGSTDHGYAKTAIGWGIQSELGHVFYVTLGNYGYCTPNDAVPSGCVSPQPGYLAENANRGPFQNFQAYVYWGSEDNTPNEAWTFTIDGLQSWRSKPGLHFAVAVRDGDVATAVPEPATYALLLSGLVVLGFVARNRRRRIDVTSRFDAGPVMPSRARH